MCVCVCVWYLNTECDVVGLKCSCDGSSKDEEKEMIYGKRKRNDVKKNIPQEPKLSAGNQPAALSVRR